MGVPPLTPAATNTLIALAEIGLGAALVIAFITAEALLFIESFTQVISPVGAIMNGRCSSGAKIP